MVTQYDRQIMYNEHRLRVQNARSIVNSQAPQRRAKQNDPINKEVQFLEVLSSLQCRKNCPRTFTKSPEILNRRSNTSSKSKGCLTCGGNSKGHIKNHQHQQQQSQQQQQFSNSNNRLLDREQSQASVGGRNNNLDKKKTDIFHIPKHVLSRYEHLQLPRGPAFMRKLLRPKIFLDLEVGHMRPLGRIVIQLFTEACPNVVLEFVRVCLAGRREFFNFTRLFTPLWLEGELTIDNDHSLAMPNIEHDTTVLDHGSGCGILSFPSRYVRGSKRNFLSFSISFKPLPVLNGKRIAFGKIRYGYRILDTIQDILTKNGKPRQTIDVTACGVIQ